MASVLVIDDDSELLEMMRLALEHRGGHHALLATDGEEGLAQAWADPPDLAIVDVMMPGINGYEVCRQLRANPLTASIPIMILTARGQPMDRQAALDAGADEYMAKPVRVSELLAGVDALLAKTSAAIPLLPSSNLVLLSLRGGTGVTTLAVNLAVSLVLSGNGPVCLVDLCPSSGHVALQLGLRPEPNWSSLIRTGDPGAEVIKTHLLQHSSGLRVLASPVVPTLAEGMPRTVAQSVLGVLRQQFAATIVDTSSVLSEATMTALEAATVVGLVVTAEHPSIQTTIGTLRVLRPWSAKTQVILNQTTPESQWSAEAVGRVLGTTPVGTIPFDPAQAGALKRGLPLAIQSPGAPLAQAIQRVVRVLARAM